MYRTIIVEAFLFIAVLFVFACGISRRSLSPRSRRSRFFPREYLAWHNPPLAMSRRIVDPPKPLNKILKRAVGSAGKIKHREMYARFLQIQLSWRCGFRFANSISLDQEHSIGFDAGMSLRFLCIFAAVAL